MTKNMVPGESVYGEKRISVEVQFCHYCCRRHFAVSTFCVIRALSSD